MNSLRETSRKDFTTASGVGTFQDIQTGAIQRIADAAEAMAQRHTELIRQRDYYEQVARDRLERLEAVKRSVSALRGVVTRLKRERDLLKEQKPEAES